MANTLQFRLKRKLFRAKTENNQPGFDRFEKGQVIVPTDEELRAFRNSFEGPLDEEQIAQAEAKESQLGEPDTEFSKLSESALTDVIRNADVALLETIAIQEAQRQPRARQKILQLIERKRKSAAA